MGFAVSVQGSAIGGGVADPTAEGAGGKIAAGGLRGDRDGREDREFEAFGEGEAEFVELIESGDRRHGHRR